MRHSSSSRILNNAHYHSVGKAFTARLGMANSKVICVRRLLVHMKANNTTFRRTLSSKFGEFLPSITTSSARFSTSYQHQDVNIHDMHDDSSPAKTLFHPRRTLMYVPASDERKTKKVASLRVDTVAFDLEDGVALSQKVAG